MNDAVIYLKFELSFIFRYLWFVLKDALGAVGSCFCMNNFS